VREKHLHLASAEFGWVAQAVVTNEAAHPAHARLLGAQPVMAHANGLAQLRQQAHGGRRSPNTCLTRTPRRGLRRVALLSFIHPTIFGRSMSEGDLPQVGIQVAFHGGRRAGRIGPVATDIGNPATRPTNRRHQGETTQASRRRKF
jgi:hypothetical protein